MVDVRHKVILSKGTKPNPPANTSKRKGLPEAGVLKGVKVCGIAPSDLTPFTSKL